MTESNPLQFDRAEFAESPAAVTCAFCKRTPLTRYFSAQGRTMCDACSTVFLETLNRRPNAAAWAKAVGLGLGAGVVSTVVYAATLHLTGYNVGLVAIGAGWLIGRAVRKGARGGQPQQVLAVALTYLSVSAALLLPNLLSLFSDGGAPDAEGWVAYGRLIIVGPFHVSSPIGLLIFAFGLYEAWRVTRRPNIEVTGPHLVASPPSTRG